MSIRKFKKNNFGKIHLSTSRSENPPLRKKNKTFFFKKKSHNSPKRNKISFKKTFNILLIILVFCSLLYLSVRVILNTRFTGENEESFEIVVGIEEVPIFPGSSFIFKDQLEESSVTNFISSGNSAYRLPFGKNFNNVKKYYESILPKYGWEYIMTVETGSETMKDGEYWKKEDKGLRIYSKFNDIWYELITIEEVSNGLSSRVQKEVERELLLANQDLMDLLPDYPWVIQIPKEYIITYKVSSFENMRSLYLKKLGTEESISLVPVAYIKDTLLDNALRKYLTTFEESEGQNSSILNTSISYTNYGKAIKGEISLNGSTHSVAVIPNSYDGVLYVLDSNSLDDPFFEYLFSSLQPQVISSKN